MNRMGKGSTDLFPMWSAGSCFFTFGVVFVAAAPFEERASSPDRAVRPDNTHAYHMVDYHSTGGMKWKRSKRERKLPGG